MKRFVPILALVAILAFAAESFATALIVRRQRVVVQQVVVQRHPVRFAAFVAPVQPVTYVPAFVAPYAAPAPERVIEKYSDGKLIERIVEK